MDFKKLKSGSDVRGVAIGENAVLTAEVARILGAAYVTFMASRLGKKPEEMTVALGRDSRLSGPDLLKATAEGIVSTGATAADYGMCTTPAMYMAIMTEGFKPDASIMITASHHPWNLNGLKFFTPEGGLGFHELDEVLAILNQYQLPTTTGFGLEEMAEAALTDKKLTGGAMHLVVLEAIGRCAIVSVPTEEIKDWMKAGGIGS